jgi:5-methylcytosine-specific restriction protein B
MQQTTHHTRAILGHIHEYISGQGYFYAKQTIANFYLSLRTKPFVILAGISGTGKTQLPRQFAAALGYPRNCHLIPVRPDWTDDTELIGYQDLEGKFRRKPLLEVILKAEAKPQEPFFVVLDEMNLARVEYYLSDILSLMETRDRVVDRIVSDPLLTASRIGGDLELLGLGIPDNLYFVGTVNMDETTHPFSRKVLDRTNVLEMSDIQLDWPPVGETMEPLAEVFNDILRSPYLHVKDISEADKKRLRPTLLQLMEINDLLKPADLHFGYRTRDEIAFYMLNRYEISELLSESEALDFQILQKILPRIHGSSRRVGEVLRALIRHFSPKTLKLSDNLNAVELIAKVGDPQKRRLQYPRSLEKLLLMYRRFEEDGFTSYWL